jgi:hypothetical protein
MVLFWKILQFVTVCYCRCYLVSFATIEDTTVKTYLGALKRAFKRFFKIFCIRQQFKCLQQEKLISRRIMVIPFGSYPKNIFKLYVYL